MEKYKCAHGPMRQKYEQKPNSFVGRFWRWHIDFCIGWKRYFNSLPASEKETLRLKYRFAKY
ncbi:MAG: hypothetical protein IKJ79_02205 [Bacteroidaceae bacterium]|nr:hypothetical protein [Bacteroidaceae bacterium]